MSANAIHQPAASTHPDAVRMPVDSADGHPITTTRLGADTAPVSVVYLHGIGTDSTYWTPLITHLHQRLDGGIAQIAYDQTGHGSTTRRRERATVDTQIEDLSAVIHAAGGPVVLVAHSLTALTVTAWVDRYPDTAHDLAGVVLLNATRRLPKATAAQRTRRPPTRDRAYGECRIAAELRAHAYQEAGPSPWRAHRRRRTVIERHPSTPAMQDLVAAYATVGPIRRAAAVLRGRPCWVHAGGADPMASVEDGRRFAEQLWADFEVVPDAGHCLPYRQPEAAAEPILACLEVAYRTAIRSVGAFDG